MPFDHERRDVYQTALEWLVIADGIVQHLPRGRSHLADQLTRAPTSIVLNIAEGAGKYSKGDIAPVLSLCGWINHRVRGHLWCRLRLELMTAEHHKETKDLLERIMSMLVKLARSQE